MLPGRRRVTFFSFRAREEGRCFDAASLRFAGSSMKNRLSRDLNQRHTYATGAQCIGGGRRPNVPAGPKDMVLGGADRVLAPTLLVRGARACWVARLPLDLQAGEPCPLMPGAQAAAGVVSSVWGGIMVSASVSGLAASAEAVPAFGREVVSPCISAAGKTSLALLPAAASAASLSWPAPPPSATAGIIELTSE